MKKLIVILMLLFSLGCYAQTNEVQKQYEWPYTYVEFGLGTLIPTDDSNSYGAVQIAVGKYVNPIIGVGAEFQGGTESKYYDHLSYFGFDTRYRLNPTYNPDKFIRWEMSLGLGYGWYTYEGDYIYDYWACDYYSFREVYSYIVPKIGLNAYIELYDRLHLGLGSEFAWYISANKENSANVGVVNAFVKLRYNF